MTLSKMSRREFLRVSGAMAGSATLLAACGGTTLSSSGTTKIVFWNPIYPTSDSNDKSKTKDQFFIYQAVKNFETANPNIKVDMQILPSTPEMFTRYRVASIAKNGPDVMALWSGNYMLQFKQYLEPMDGYFTQEERSHLRGWEAVTDGFKIGAGKTYGVPNAIDGISVIFYNKQLLQKAGVDPEMNWPADFGQFLQMLAKIKASGVTPLALFDNGYTFFSMDYWIAQVVGGSGGIGDLINGKRNFSDPDVVNVLQQWSKLAQYSVSGAPTMEGSQAQQLFQQGKAAMMVNGPWPIDDMRTAMGDTFGMHKLPDFSTSVSVKNAGIGGCGTALIVSNYSKHKPEAVKFVKFLVSKQEEQHRAESSGEGLINSIDVDVSKIYKDPLKVQNQEWGLEPQTMFWPDNAFPAELTNEISAQAQLAWTGKITPQQFAQKLDAKRDEILHAPKQ